MEFVNVTLGDLIKEQVAEHIDILRGPPWVTKKEAAQLLGCSASTLARHISLGRLHRSVEGAEVRMGASLAAASSWPRAAQVASSRRGGQARPRASSARTAWYPRRDHDAGHRRAQEEARGATGQAEGQARSPIVGWCALCPWPFPLIVAENAEPAPKPPLGKPHHRRRSRRTSARCRTSLSRCGLQETTRGRTWSHRPH